MWDFLLSGLIGSAIPLGEIYAGLLVNYGAVGVIPFIHLIAGLLGGYSGYGLFSLIKSSSKYVELGMIVVSGIVGFGFSFLYVFFIH